MLVIIYYLIFWLYIPKALFEVKPIYSYVYKKLNLKKTVEIVKNIKIISCCGNSSNSLWNVIEN